MWFKIGIGLIIIVIIAAFLGYSLTSKYAKIGDSFFNYLKIGKTQEAYNLYSKAMHEAVSYENFVEQNAFATQIVKVSWNSRVYENGIATIKGTMILEDQTKIDLSMKIIKEKNIWKIGAIKVRPISEPAK